MSTKQIAIVAAVTFWCWCAVEALLQRQQQLWYAVVVAGNDGARVSIRHEKTAGTFVGKAIYTRSVNSTG